jgi:hypothetical protein
LILVQQKRVIRELKIGEIIRELRLIAQECENAARESPDEELSEFLREMSAILTSFADALGEYNQ